MPKQSSPAMSSLASKVLNGLEPNRDEIESMAASILSLDQTKGQAQTELAAEQPEGGGDFIEALKTAIAPLTIANMASKTDHILITLSDGKVLEVKRQRAKADPEGYVAELLG